MVPLRILSHRLLSRLPVLRRTNTILYRSLPVPLSSQIHRLSHTNIQTPSATTSTPCPLTRDGHCAVEPVIERFLEDIHLESTGTDEYRVKDNSNRSKNKSTTSTNTNKTFITKQTTQKGPPADIFLGAESPSTVSSGVDRKTRSRRPPAESTFERDDIEEGELYQRHSTLPYEDPIEEALDIIQQRNAPTTNDYDDTFSPSSLDESVELPRGVIQPPASRLIKLDDERIEFSPGAGTTEEAVAAAIRTAKDELQLKIREIRRHDAARSSARPAETTTNKKDQPEESA